MFYLTGGLSYFLNVNKGKRARRNMDRRQLTVLRAVATCRGLAAKRALRRPDETFRRVNKPLGITMFEELSQRYQQLPGRFVVVQEQCTSLARRGGMAISGGAQVAGPPRRVHFSYGVGTAF